MRWGCVSRAGMQAFLHWTGEFQSRRMATSFSWSGRAEQGLLYAFMWPTQRPRRRGVDSANRRASGAHVPGVPRPPFREDADHPLSPHPLFDGSRRSSRVGCFLGLLASSLWVRTLS